MTDIPDGTSIFRETPRDEIYVTVGIQNPNLCSVFANISVNAALKSCRAFLLSPLSVRCRG